MDVSVVRLRRELIRRTTTNGYLQLCMDLLFKSEGGANVHIVECPHCNGRGYDRDDNSIGDRADECTFCMGLGLLLEEME